MKHWLVALPLAVASLFAAPATAQTQSKDLIVSVFDNKDQVVKDGLTPADFAIREDGVAREVLKVVPATAPLQIALVIDDSQAANPAIQMMREGLTSFVDMLSGKAEIALTTSGERPTILVDYTTDTVKLKAGINRIFYRPSSGSYLLDALVEVSKGLQKREAQRPVIVAVFVEAGVEFSNRYYQQVVDEINKSHAALHVLAIGQPNSGTTDELRNRNQTIAEGTEQTGGRRDQVLAVSALPTKLKQVADELSHQWVVTYARPETLIPPERVEVTSRRPDLTVRARTRLAGK